MYNCAIVGVSGQRARGLADAYSRIRRGRLAAVSARKQSQLDAFGEAYGVAARYTDYREMFAREKPDLVHVNTPPDVRLEVLEAAEAETIPAVLVEKPIAVQGEDYLELCDFAASCKTRIAINHQLHFHPRRQILQALVAEGKIGDIRFVDASAGMNMAYQGTHSLQALGAFRPRSVPRAVIAQACGAEGLRDNVKKHFAPDECLAQIQYDDDSRAILHCGPGARKVRPDDEICFHKRVSVYGTRGSAHWTMWSWETWIDGRHTIGEHDYMQEDIEGQAAMTEAMFDWIENPRAEHPLRLTLALQDFQIVLAAYTSALRRESISLPFTPPRDLIASLRDALAARRT